MAINEEKAGALALRFNWWWRSEDGRAKAVDAYAATLPEHRKEEGNERLWKSLRWAAFHYERLARREYKPGQENTPLYPFEQPFNGLNHSQMAVLASKWPANFVVNSKRKTRVVEPVILEVSERPTKAQLWALDQLAEDVICSGDEAENPANHDQPWRERPELEHFLREPLKEPSGERTWSVAKWISFDLSASNEELAMAFLKLVDEQRMYLEIPQVRKHANKGKARRTESGPVFGQIEKLDCYANLDPTECAESGLTSSDEANARATRRTAGEEWEEYQRWRENFFSGRPTHRG